MDESEGRTGGQEPELAHLLDEKQGPAASADNLRAILGRHTRRRRRFAGGIAAAALVVGAGGGVAIGEAVTTGTAGSPVAGGNQPAATTSPGPALPGAAAPGSAAGLGTPPSGLSWAAGGSPAASVMGPNMGAPLNATSQTVGGSARPPLSCADTSCHSYVQINGSGAMRSLFDRTANGVDVRAYTVSYLVEPVPEPAQPLPASTAGTVARAQPILQYGCLPRSALELEVSDAGAVGVMSVPDVKAGSQPFSVVQTEVFGTGEGSPMEVIAVRAGTAVTSVTAHFSGGATDSMAVTGGWAVLVATEPASSSGQAVATAELTAYGGDGRVLERASVPETTAYALPSICVGPAYPANGRLPGGTASTGSGSSSGGSITGGSSGGSSSGGPPTGAPTPAGAPAAIARPAVAP